MPEIAEREAKESSVSRGDLAPGEWPEYSLLYWGPPLLSPALSGAGAWPEAAAWGKGGPR